MELDEGVAHHVLAGQALEGGGLDEAVPERDRSEAGRSEGIDGASSHYRPAVRTSRGGGMDPLETMGRVIDESRRVVHGVTPDQLDNKTLCTEWTVRDIINHITGGATYFGEVAERGSIPDEEIAQLLGGGDNLGDDYKAAFDTAADRFFESFRQPGMLDKIVKLPFGEVPAAVAITIGI